MNLINRFFERKYSKLIYGLFCSFGYFGIIQSFLLQNAGYYSKLLIFFFLPVIICAPAIAAIKFCDNMIQNGKYKSFLIFTILHIILFFISVFFLISAYKGI